MTTEGCWRWYLSQRCMPMVVVQVQSHVRIVSQTTALWKPSPTAQSMMPTSFSRLVLSACKFDFTLHCCSVWVGPWCQACTSFGTSCCRVRKKVQLSALKGKQSATAGSKTLKLSRSVSDLLASIRKESRAPVPTVSTVFSVAFRVSGRATSSIFVIRFTCWRTRDPRQ